MRKSMLLTLALVLGAWSIALGHPSSGIEYFVPQYPPTGPGIVVDADFDDWAGYPAETTITVDMLYVHAGDDMDLDPSDFDATIKWCWNDANNYWYGAVEQFDDVYNPIPEVGFTETYMYDDMEATIDADNSGGRYQYGEVQEAGQNGQTGQQVGFGPSPEPYYLVYRIEGATWMNVPPYTEYWATVTNEATGTRIKHEFGMVLWDFLHASGPEQSIAHDLQEGDTIGFTHYFDDYDEDPSRLGGQWKTHERPDVPHSADGCPDVHLLGFSAWDASMLPTAVNAAAWGSIKATFAQ